MIDLYDFCALIRQLRYYFGLGVIGHFLMLADTWRHVHNLFTITLLPRQKGLSIYLKQ